MYLVMEYLPGGGLRMLLRPKKIKGFDFLRRIFTCAILSQ